MSMINVAKGFRQYSPTELREDALKGLIEVNGWDAGDFLEYIFTDYRTNDKEEIAEAQQEGYDKGWSDAKAEAIAAVENI